MRIGILGGTFDPVHNGHLYLAKKVYHKLKLSRIIFIPAYNPPHKKVIKLTHSRHRYNMLKLAVSDSKAYKISDMEIKRRGKSYSVETLKRLRKRYGAKAELFFITGSDSLRELGKWKDMEEILKLCRFVVVERPGFRAGRSCKAGIKHKKTQIRDFYSRRLFFLKINAKDISATMVRNRIKTGESLAGLVPGRVVEYIYRNKLYV